MQKECFRGVNSGVLNLCILKWIFFAFHKTCPKHGRWHGAVLRNGCQDIVPPKTVIFPFSLMRFRKDVPKMVTFVLIKSASAAVRKQSQFRVLFGAPKEMCREQSASKNASKEDSCSVLRTGSVILGATGERIYIPVCTKIYKNSCFYVLCPKMNLFFTQTTDKAQIDRQITCQFLPKRTEWVTLHVNVTWPNCGIFLASSTECVSNNFWLTPSRLLAHLNNKNNGLSRTSETQLCSTLESAQSYDDRKICMVAALGR